MDIQNKADQICSTSTAEANKVGWEQSPIQIADYGLLLIEDSTLELLPHYVMKIMTELNLNPKNALPTDILIVLIYCIALESGFVSKAVIEKDSQEYSYFWGFSYNSRNVRQLAKCPPGLLECRLNFYYCTLNLLGFRTTNCKLVCIQTGDSLCVTLVPDNNQGFSICISIARYVLTMRTECVTARLRNLKELSLLMKNNIFTPVRNLVMEQSRELYCGLNGVPNEVLFFIFKYLGKRDLINLSRTCWEMRRKCIAYNRVK